jgi:hypothetical protein
MPVIDDLVRLLKENEVGLWCRRAAWLIAVIETILLALNLFNILAHADPFSLPVQVLTAILSALATTLWFFFVLYALGIVADAMARRLDR